MGIGEIIKLRRRRLGYNQVKLAKILGITQTYLSQIESGIKNPSIGMLKIISIAINVPLSVLVWLSVDQSQVKPGLQEAYNDLKPIMDRLIISLLIGES